MLHILVTSSDASVRRMALWCGGLAVATASLVLTGWEVDLPLLRQGLPQWAPMRPWSAVVTLLAGLGLVLAAVPATPLRRAAMMLLAALIAAVAVIMLGGDALGAARLEHALYPDLLAQEPLAKAGRIPPVIGVEFLVAALLIALSPLRFKYVGSAYAASASFGCGLSLAVIVGHLYSTQFFYQNGLIATASVLAAATNLVLFLGFLLARPEVGALRLLRSAELGGMAARRLFPVVIFVPIAIGWVLVALSRRLSTVPEVSIALFTVLTIAMLLTLVFFVARQLERIDAQRRGAEEAARRHQERLALAQEVVGAGAWDRDLVTGECTWSDSYFRLMGLDPAATQASDAAFLERVHPDDRASVIAVMDRMVVEGGPFHCEYRVVRPDGSLRHMTTLATVLRNGRGRPVRATGLNFDVTDRVTMAQRLDRAKQEAEHANMAKSKFLAAASHDLRQPVQSLTLFVGVLKQRLTGTPAESVLVWVERSVDALRQMLDTLLDISRLDAGIIKPNFEVIPLGPLLQRLAEEYAPRAQPAGLRLRCIATRVSVCSDPVLLERMLRNFIENALRYTKRGGVVIGCRHRGAQVLVTVCDSGIGIAPEDEAAIFEEFFQVDNPERDRSKGFGLGLAIVQRLGRLLGHQVALRSRPGHGSCFSIELPTVVAPAAEEIAPADRPAEQTAEDETVMIIEDDQLVREGLGAALTGWGYRVAAAGSVAEAVREVDQLGHPPSMVIADYRLRENETGTIAIEAVRKRCGTVIPALVITGDTAPERLREAKAAGVELVHKPIPMDSLRDVVAHLTRH